MRKSISIGRDPTIDFSLRDAKASRLHARVECRPDGVWVTDLKSKNGTFINGVAIDRCRLDLGDRMVVGDTQFRLLADAKPEPVIKPHRAHPVEPLVVPTVSVSEGDSLAGRLQAFYKLRTGKEGVDKAPPGPLRLIVFEVDGTLITTDGLVSETFEQALNEVYGVPNAFRQCPMAGRSEREVVRVALRAAKITPDRIEQGLPKALARYVDLLVEALRKRPRGDILPGVRPLLERLGSDPRWAVGLLTRHLMLSARPLLGRHGLWDFFKFGVFADDHDERAALPALLVERAREASGLPLQPQDLYAVGDTVRDLACAKAAGLRTVAVATGGSSYEALSVLNPDLIFRSFENIDDVLEKLNLGLPGVS
jgi:phosphoglycolate phosphatase-like HAD superfamily hydrolase